MIDRERSTPETALPRFALSIVIPVYNGADDRKILDRVDEFGDPRAAGQGLDATLFLNHIQAPPISVNTPER